MSGAADPALDALMTAVAPLCRGVPVGPDTPLLSSGLVGSLELARLLALLEARFGAAPELADVGADNFDTPRQMRALLAATPGSALPGST
nr:hypothetical protein [uncultured bacterium]